MDHAGSDVRRFPSVQKVRKRIIIMPFKGTRTVVEMVSIVTLPRVSILEAGASAPAIPEIQTARKGR